MRCGYTSFMKWFRLTNEPTVSVNETQTSFGFDKSITALIPIATVYGYGKRPNCTNVTCDSRTIFSLHLHKQIASQKEWTEILNLHFFSSSAQPIERFDSIISSGYVLHTVLMKSVTTVVTTTVLGSTICVYTSVVPVNMLFIHWDVTTRADTWRDEAVNRYQQQQTTTTTLLK